MTADALFGFFWLLFWFLFFFFFFLYKYAAFSGDQPVDQLCCSAMRTLAAEKSVFLIVSSRLCFCISTHYCY